MDHSKKDIKITTSKSIYSEIDGDESSPENQGEFKQEKIDTGKVDFKPDNNLELENSKNSNLNKDENILLDKEGRSNEESSQNMDQFD